MNRRLLLRLALIASLAPVLSVAGQPVKGPEEGLHRLQIEADLRFIASDELEGRQTGTPGGDTAARYIAESFRAAGARSFPELKDYLQRIPFRRTTPPQQLHLRLGDQSVDSARIAWLGGEGGSFQGEALYAESWSDQLKGKIWLAPLSLAGGPARLEEQLNERWEEGIRNGALALVHLYAGDSGWERLVGYLGRPRLELAHDREDSIPHLLAAFAPDPTRQTTSAELQFVSPRIEDFTSSNVVGMIEGSDPDARDDFIALVAHYDHLGESDGTGAGTDQDLIFNGARDNGMGIAALLGAARALSLRPPRRSVLLLAVTGEEQGLLGSRYFVENPIVPLGKTSFALNADGAGFTDAGVVTVIGLDRTTARDAIARAAADFELEAISGPPEAAGLFSRSDNFSFARKGVPSVTYSPGFRLMNQELMLHYHQTSDEAGDNFDFAYLVKFVRAFARAARNLADSEIPVHWAPGDPFEGAGRSLYGLP